MSDKFVLSGSLVKKVGTVQEELHSFSKEYSGDEVSCKTIVLPEIDAAELSLTSEVHSVDMSFLNSDPPTDGAVRLVVVEVLTSGKRVIVKPNVPDNVITALETSPITDTSTDPFDATSYVDIEGIFVDNLLILGGKISNLYINRYPLEGSLKDVTADSGDCRVSVRVIGG